MPADPPWPKGSHSDFSAFVIEVHVRRDQTGALRSSRNLQDNLDEDTAMNMAPSGGLTEGATALLIEAAKTEAMLQALVVLSHDKTFRDRLLSGSEEQKQQLIQNLIRDSSSVMKDSLDRFLPQLCEETIKQITDGISS
jgi:hypothetical protein